MMEERREAPAGEAETAVSAADAGEEGPGEAEALREQLRACEERVLRLAAELDNFKKRVEREKAEHMRYALEAFAKELLPFLDNLERAVAAAKDSGETDEKLVEGLELALSGYLKTLERFGLKAYSCMGQRFDPNFHEALSVQECHDVEENTVVQELLKGYSLHERVIRPALVVVSKKPPEGSGQGEPSA
ncbi:nucleotide exchange factor GrpE [Dissulfurirhabdus thermomarina]|uniref:Protein GrpE n=1 Tax=Dissulfurirhabdus thermomarina TaxID=1765737 RepID=A0A6N9TSI9_DISTH|nr:nucleotide exchange factor GrpE [Dissulfurirhabdus thermomarina]NDY43370.1 nucleotide exchange factor GrpE [Dissulfurirhabdus thermomarina]NMX23648.1 nucleotide exchange factor GrpE [Dissulfurirhabdus thermomarina]